MSAQIAVAVEKDRGSAEGGTAAAEYEALNASKDPKAIVAGEYRLDPHHTSVTAKLAHMGLSDYTLRFDAVAGRFAFDSAYATAMGMAIAIETKSIDTGNQAFDRKIAGKYGAGNGFRWRVMKFPFSSRPNLFRRDKSQFSADMSTPHDSGLVHRIQPHPMLFAPLASLQQKVNPPEGGAAVAHQLERKRLDH